MDLGQQVSFCDSCIFPTWLYAHEALKGAESAYFISLGTNATKCQALWHPYIC